MSAMYLTLQIADGHGGRGNIFLQLRVQPDVPATVGGSHRIRSPLPTGTNLATQNSVASSSYNTSPLLNRSIISAVVYWYWSCVDSDPGGMAHVTIRSLPTTHGSYWLEDSARAGTVSFRHCTVASEQSGCSSGSYHRYSGPV